MHWRRDHSGKHGFWSPSAPRSVRRPVLFQFEIGQFTGKLAFDTVFRPILSGIGKADGTQSRRIRNKNASGNIFILYAPKRIRNIDPPCLLFRRVSHHLSN
jgi:hypothetical protein